MRPFIVDDSLWLCENAIYLPKLRTLVIADLQLGMEQQLRSLGHNIVYEQAQKMLELLKDLIAKTGATRLVIDGDLKHEFGRISAQERRDISKLLRALKGIEIIAVRGNHDTITKPITDEAGVPFMDAWREGGVLAIHGHQDVDIPKGVKDIVIGHLHPAITLDDGVRRERYKCFLIGTYKRKRLIVLPSFSTIVEGTDVLKGESHSPFVKEFSKMRAYVIADEIRDFGQVKGIRDTLRQ